MGGHPPAITVLVCLRKVLRRLISATFLCFPRIVIVQTHRIRSAIMSGLKCCVVGCNSTRRDTALHSFPKTEIGLQKWLECIGCDSLRSLSVVQLRSRRVCRKHFEKRFHTSARHKPRLRVDAFPTLFTESEIATGKPQMCQIALETASGSSLPPRRATHAGYSDHIYTLKRKHEDHTYSGIEKRTRTAIDMNPMSSCSGSEIMTNVNHLLKPIPTEQKGDDAAIALQQCVSTKPSKATTDMPGFIDMNPILSLSSSENVTYVNRPSKLIPTEQRGDDAAIALHLQSVSTTPPKATTDIPGLRGGIPRRLKMRNRIVNNVGTLTPKCSKLYKLYVKSRRQLNFNLRAKKAVKFTKEQAFDNLTKDMNPITKKILWMQISQYTKRSQGRRFTEEEKLIALAIMKQSPKCYKFLHKLFILPSKQTLNKMISSLNIEAGINTQIFDALKQEVSTWKETKKICSIIFDEVALEAGLHYNKQKDCIDGFVDLNEKCNDFADHALVFMIRGAIEKWQQPLAYYFCKGATAAVQLKKIIKEVITAVSNTGLHPVALISDQGTAFQSALKSLQEETRSNHLKVGEEIDDIIEVNGHTLSIIYDPPHLLKGLRNNFLTKNIEYKEQISKWSDIVEVYKTDCSHAHMRLLHKLNDEHVIPEKIKKMKVRNCARVLSKTVAATLSYSAQFAQYADGTPVSPTLKNTAEIVSFFDDLFDSVNGASTYSKKNKGKPLRQAVTEKTKHIEFWRDAIKKLESIKFVDDKGKKISVPSIKNWIITLKSFLRLQEFFKTKNVKIMRPRYFNSDPIENFFGQVRAYNFRNNDPDCHTFQCTFKSLLITRFIQFHSSSFNCEEDSGEQLLKLKNLFTSIPSGPRSEGLTDSPDSSKNQSLVKNNAGTAGQERLRIHARAYTTGWVLRKILKKYNCKDCENNLCTEESQQIHTWINSREFKALKEKKLTYPSEYATRLFGHITDETLKMLENTPHEKKLIEKLKNNLKYHSLFDFMACSNHKNDIIEDFLDYTIKLAVFNWCNTINKILKGTDIFRIRNKELPPMQSKALKKFQTKLKNKRLKK